MKIKILQARHPEFDGETLDEYSLLYKGGKDILINAQKFINKRPKEPQMLYNARLSMAFYIGYIGPIIDFFLCNLFGNDASIKQKGKSKLPSYYTTFFKNVDKRHTDFNQFFKKVFTNTLLHKKSFILVDFPRVDSSTKENIRTAEDEYSLGLDQAYLVQFTRDELIDWDLDDDGNYNWVKFHCVKSKKNNFDDDAAIQHCWYIYTKYNYQVFEFLETADNKLTDDKEASLIAEGEHMFPGRLPLFCLQVPDGLWLANKLASVQTEIFNLDCAMAWQEYNGHFAMPIINLRQGKKFNQTVGEAYYIQLELDEEFRWAEPEGKMMEIGLKRRESLKDELYRIVHQLSLSIKQTKSQTRQSGSSKQEDRFATEIVLCAFGDTIRDSMQKILQMISDARNENIDWDVTGFDTFDTETLTEKLAQALQVKAFEVHSETYQKLLEKRIVDLTIPDANQEDKDKCHKEIDAADLSIIVDPLTSFMPNAMIRPTGSSESSRPKGPGPGEDNPIKDKSGMINKAQLTQQAPNNSRPKNK